MKNVRNYVVPVLLITLLCFASCTKEDVLYVKSIDYPGLTELHAEFPDEDTIRGWNFFTLNPYYPYVCRVSLSGEDLVITNDRTSLKAFTMMGDHGYFLGVTLGEWDGWVKLYPYHSALAPEIVGEPQMVVNENCRGIIQINNALGYLLVGTTGSILDTEAALGAIYELRLNKESREWEWEKLSNLPGYPLLYEYDEDGKTIYIATHTELLSFSVEDKSVVSLADLRIWASTGALSIVQRDQTLYLGMAMGIYEFDLTKNDWKWYPMHYEEYVS